jgi:hypothetical protein
MVAARAAGETGSPAAGAGLILEADDCGDLKFTHPSSAGELEDALTDGAFAYRNGTEGFVATADGGAALFTADWPVWIGGRAMVIALPLTPGSAVVETPVGTFAYRFGLLIDQATSFPAVQQDDIATVELCEAAVTYAVGDRIGRIKANGDKTVVQNVDNQNNLLDIVGFCDPEPAPDGFLARAVHKVIGFFAPAPLQASLVAPPGMAGGIGELSDIVGANAQSLNLTGATGAKKGKINTDLIYTVTVKGALGTPLENVAITPSIEGNLGNPGMLVGGCTNTNEFGVSTCTFQITSTGGYIFRFTAVYAGYPDAFILSSPLINLSQN